LVTNLPAEAKAKWMKVMDAKTPEEKIKAIQDFLSYVPKHKGTENLVYWAKRRLAELKEEAEKEKRKGGGKRSFSIFVEKAGAGQVVLLGDAFLRTELLRALTNVKVIPRDVPVPGMAPFEDIKLQLVNPPLTVPLSKVVGLARNADAIVIVANDLQEYEQIKKFLEDNNVLLKKPRGKVIIERSRYGNSGLRIVNLGKIVDSSESEIRKYLEGFGIKSAIVRILGEITMDDVEKAIFESVTFKPGVLVSPKPLGVDVYSLTFNVARRELPKVLFESLDVIRVYTKEPGEDATGDPLIMRKGSTVMDVARRLHSSLAEGMRYARVWGKSVKFPGQKVGGDHILEDKDIIEIHTK
jgi:ribosome-interacting GTPase 1